MCHLYLAGHCLDLLFLLYQELMHIWQRGVAVNDVFLIFASSFLLGLGFSFSSFGRSSSFYRMVSSLGLRGVFDKLRMFLHLFFSSVGAGLGIIFFNGYGGVNLIHYLFVIVAWLVGAFFTGKVIVLVVND
ncbi:MAG: hypothetical protein ACJAUE_002709 [Alcanivorax sp.]